MFTSVKKLKPKQILIIILIFTALSRLINIGYPNSYVFDEVYHAFTAKQFLINNKAAWEYWTTPPKGVAFEWTHPPVAKEIMAISMGIVQTTDAWAYRLPGVLMGILAVYLVYLIGKKLFQKEAPALISAFIFSIDGLNFVQSRTGMNDIYMVAFMLAALWLLLANKFFLSGILLGLSIASKWSGVYLIPVVFIYLVWKRKFLPMAYFLCLPVIVYLISYLPFFLLGHSWTQFIELQQQMWWYHTGLKATHDYASSWWSWPLNLYPVWYYVSYQGNQIGNIFASGNPMVFWSGAVAIILTAWEIIRNFIISKKTSLMSFLQEQESILIILMGYFAFWLPWAVSPRIMFLYHYSPSVPFLSLTLGYQLNKLNNPEGKKSFYLILILMFVSFLFVYPFLTGIPLPRSIMELFFYTNITKNPFG